ncbi:uncharacterized protein STEHIDRAFT_97071 [Stereum hirsutum FP-91666 SS1]|uniref:uncharacterized protein n=1 Tax=Stereum hirsutum (strain FP-91666) TaxID=721885 RepID=UPI000440F8E5|nr:uncharacterized protein STEHIDRAFT_97071 [Stereum hirsutum FP-91666 SS1]EIM86435.1 hypothetical protein STEHIDRAFT_97071 [Stereum hirsutum FP-91666 SS1]
MLYFSSLRPPLRFRPPSSCYRPFSFTPNTRFIKPTRYLRNVPPQSQLRPQAIPSFREQVARVTPIKSFADSIKRPKILKHIITSILASGAVYIVAAGQTNIDTAFWAQFLPSFNPIWSMRSPTSEDMHRMRDGILLKKIQNQVDSLAAYMASYPVIIKQFVVHCYAAIGENYINSSEGRRLAWGVGAASFGIWLAWQVPRFNPWLMRNFAHSPLSGRTYTLMTSVISHRGFLHWFFNITALSGFGSATSNWMRREQSHAPSGMQEATTSNHFFAFLVTAGLFSSLCSHIYSARFKFSRIISQLSRPPPSITPSTSRPSLLRRLFSSSPPPSTPPASDASKIADALRPSLGISGAVWSCVMITGLAFPDAQVRMFFDGAPPFSIKWAIYGGLGFDILGLIYGWRRFDHVAHLGGALFGALYFRYGIEFWDWLRAALWDSGMEEGFREASKDIDWSDDESKK